MFACFLCLLYLCDIDQLIRSVVGVTGKVDARLRERVVHEHLTELYFLIGHKRRMLNIECSLRRHFEIKLPYDSLR